MKTKYLAETKKYLEIVQCFLTVNGKKFLISTTLTLSVFNGLNVQDVERLEKSL